jgi:beta-glucosidase
MAGAAVTMREWDHDVPAILMAWYPGMEGGSALADVLLGTGEPGGRLPFAVPYDEGDLPPFDRFATTVTYDRWHGQRLLDRDGRAAAYPLGFGLSYTTFTIGGVDVALRPDTATVEVRATVENTGERPGGHVVQAYATRPAGGERFLVGFARVDGPPGERMPVRIDIPLQRLATRRGPGQWTVPPGSYRIDVGANAADPTSASATIALP